MPDSSKPFNIADALRGSVPSEHVNPFPGESTNPTPDNTFKPFGEGEVRDIFEPVPGTITFENEPVNQKSVPTTELPQGGVASNNTSFTKPEVTPPIDVTRVPGSTVADEANRNLTIQRARNLREVPENFNARLQEIMRNSGADTASQKRAVAEIEALLEVVTDAI